MSSRHPRHDQREFLAAQPEGVDAGPVILLDDCGEAAQHPVADRMAIDIVGPLEMIEVEHGDRHERTEDALAIERIQSPPVHQAGQRVGHGLGLQFDLRLQMVQRQRQRAERRHAGDRHDGIQPLGPIVGRDAEHPLALDQKHRAAEPEGQPADAAQRRNDQQNAAIMTAALDPEHHPDRGEQHRYRRIGEDEADTVETEIGHAGADRHRKQGRQDGATVIAHAEILHGRKRKGEETEAEQRQRCLAKPGIGLPCVAPEDDDMGDKHQDAARHRQHEARPRRREPDRKHGNAEACA